MTLIFCACVKHVSFKQKAIPRTVMSQINLVSKCQKIEERGNGTVKNFEVEVRVKSEIQTLHLKGIAGHPR